MAASVSVQPCKPRTCEWQRNRPNVAIPFIDHIIADLLSPLPRTASSLLHLVPSVLYTSTDVDFAEVVEMYSSDLPSPELFDQELSLWKHSFANTPASERPATCASSSKSCDSCIFPNVYTLLKIAWTIPVTSCECERNASILRNFMRCTMTEERLTSLALMHIHYDKEINLGDVVDIFSKYHPRRLQLSSILY